MKAQKNMKIKKNSPLFGIIYGVILSAFTVYALLDTFVIPRTYAVTSDETASGSTPAASEADPSGSGITETAAVTALETSSVTSQVSSDSSITITTYRENNTNIYVADIRLQDLSALKTAFADGTYGRNIKEKTSAIAASAGATLAINGDFYGAQESGYVIRNGILYRDTSAGSDQEDLVIYNDGTFGIINEGDTTAQELLDNGAYQVLSFGPALIENSTISVTENDEVGKAMASNPRTAIGIISPLHYVFVVSDGRTSESSGLSLDQLASFMQSLGVTTAYNLDGGGSSTMVYNGTVINKPTTNGNTIKERSVSDIVCIE